MTIKSKMLLKMVGKKSYDVVQMSEGGYVNGRWVEGTESTITIKGNEQPLPGYEIQMLPEAFRSKDTRKFFSLSSLRSIDEATGITPDKVIIDNVKFEVHKKKSYQMGPRSHYEYTLVREEQSAGGTS